MVGAGKATADDLGTLEQLAATEIPPLPLMELATIQDQTVAELTLSKRDIQLALDKKGDSPDLFVDPQLSNLRLDRITLGLGGPSHGAREHLVWGPELGTHATFLAPSSAHHLRGNFRVVNRVHECGCVRTCDWQSLMNARSCACWKRVEFLIILRSRSA